MQSVNRIQNFSFCFPFGTSGGQWTFSLLSPLSRLRKLGIQGKKQKFRTRKEENSTLLYMQQRPDIDRLGYNQSAKLSLKGANYYPRKLFTNHIAATNYNLASFRRINGSQVSLHPLHQSPKEFPHILPHKSQDTRPSGTHIHNQHNAETEPHQRTTKRNARRKVYSLLDLILGV